MENRFMKRALFLARTAEKNGDVPVGAVVVKDNEIIGEGYNTREKNNDISGHAEINALKAAAAALGTWKLADCDIYVTLEPCPMCASALAAARIRSVYFGAYDKTAGALESAMRLYDMPFGVKPDFYGGISEDECSHILRDFFKKKREL